MSKNGNKSEKPVRSERKATFAGALIAFLLCVAVIMGGIVGLGLDAQTALVGAIIVMMVFGVCFLHIKFQDMVQAMVRSLNDSLECILILLVIGMLIASWMACGTVPYIIYLGLGLLNPSWYLPSSSSCARSSPASPVPPGRRSARSAWPSSVSRWAWACRCP